MKGLLTGPFLNSLYSHRPKGGLRLPKHLEKQMIETLGILLLIFIALYFDKKEEVKRLKEHNQYLRSKTIKAYMERENYEARDFGEK